jgi:hypothetical protein
MNILARPYMICRQPANNVTGNSQPAESDGAASKKRRLDSDNDDLSGGEIIDATEEHEGFSLLPLPESDTTYDAKWGAVRYTLPFTSSFVSK